MSITCTNGLKEGVHYAPSQQSPIENPTHDSSETGTVKHFVDPQKQSALTQSVFNRGSLEITINYWETEEKTGTQYTPPTYSYVGNRVSSVFSFPNKALFVHEKPPTFNFSGKDYYDKFFREAGYNSFEKFLGNTADDRKKAADAAAKGILSPGPQARKWLTEGVGEDWKRRITDRFQKCLNDIKGKSFAQQTNIIKRFYLYCDNLLANDIPKSLNEERNKLEELFINDILRKIEYKKPNPYFPKPEMPLQDWPWTANKERWYEDWKKLRLPLAEESVKKELKSGQESILNELKALVLQYAAELKASKVPKPSKN